MSKILHGFTIIEFVIVIAIFGIIATIAGPLIYQLSRLTLQQYEISNVSGQARIALERMSKDLREIRSTSTSDLQIASNQITFVDINGNTITYQLSGSTLLRNSQPLADSVTAFNLTYQKNDGTVALVAADVRYITISMTISENNTTETLQHTIFIRNFS